MVLSGLKVILQAAFFVAIPRWAPTSVASTTYLVMAMSAVINPVAALGSQFRAIKAVAAGRDLGSTIAAATLGLLAASALAMAMYVPYRGSLAAGTLATVTSYIAVNYVRLYVDAVAQGAGHYNLCQAAYIAFWAAKLLGVGLLSMSGDVSFGELVVVEAVASSPWMCVATVIAVRAHEFGAWRPTWEEDFSVSIATLARMGWMEGDKLLLGLIADPSAYVEYSLAIRPSTAGIALVAAVIGVATPRLIRGSPEIIATLLREGRLPVALACAAVVLGSAGILILYPESVRATAPVMLISLLAVPGYFVSHVYADYVFYRYGGAPRLAANLIGATTVAMGGILVAWSGAVPIMATAAILSYLLVVVFTRAYLRRVSQ